MNDTERKPDLKKRESSTGQHDDLDYNQDEIDSEVADLENLYRKPAAKKRNSKIWSKKKKATATVAGLTAGISIGIGMFFSPLLKLEGYMQSINQRAFTVAASAVESRASHLFERYMIGYLIDLDSCTAAVSLDCKQTYGNKGLAAGLFSSWKDARIEAKLFDEYFLEVRTTRKDGITKHKLFDRSGAQIDLSKDNVTGSFRNIVSNDGRRETGREIRRFLKDSTKWYQVLERRSVRNFLERKHGIKTWCMISCKSRDSLADRKDTVAFKYKSRFINRFVNPFSAKWGFILQCMVSGNCNDKDIADIKLARKSLSESDLDILRGVAENPNQKLTQVVLRNILNKLVLKEAFTDRVVNAIPIVGQILLVATIAELLEKTDSFVEDNGFSKFAANINSAQYLEFYSATRSDNDAMKAGAMSIEEVGETLSYFEGAEQSLVYKAYNNDGEPKEEDPEYICKDGSPISVEDGDLVCEEKKIQRTYAIEQILNTTIAGAPIDGLLLNYRLIQPVIGPILGLINNLSELFIGKAVTGALNILRGCEDLDSIEREATEKELKECNYLDEFIAYGTDKFAGWIDNIFARIFPLPITLDSPGRDFYNGLEAGADVAANSFAAGGNDSSGETYGLGAPLITDADVAAIFNESLSQQAYEYNSQGLFERATDLDYKASFANTLISNIPSNPSVAGLFTSVASSFTNLINGSMFSSFINGGAVNASEYASSRQLSVNAFGVERYGYKLNDPTLTADPDTYTEEYCALLSIEREEIKTRHELTGLEQYTTADPCQLERAVIEAAGDFFTDD
jgi:hypothetical protein